MTAPPVLTLSDIGLHLGGMPLFTDVTLTLSMRERAALIGRNGAGKSTLMRLITRQNEPDSGTLWIQPGTQIATVVQEPDLSGYDSVQNYVADGLEQAWRAAAELDHFGLNTMATAAPATLSGGQIRRAALARAFAQDPEILLLDEPTNHLDITMIETLEARLLSFAGAVLIISHDRRFLENVTTSLLWLRDRKILRNACGYGYFERWAETIETAERKQITKMKTHIRKEEHWLHRGVTGRRARNAGRLARLKAMRTDAARRRAELANNKATVELNAAESTLHSRKVIDVAGLCKAFGDTRIVEDLTYRVFRGDRIGLIGPNGVGKTTLLNLLLNRIPRDSGRVRLNKALRITYLDQTRQTLKANDTLWHALVPNGGDSLDVQGKQRHVAAYARDFLFKPEQLQQPVGALSGGERNRLTLAIALARTSDLLVLDEPTNDLDMQTLELLEDMLLNFTGTLLLTSHDRAFLDAAVTSCLVPVGNGRWVETAGGWTSAQSQIKMHDARPPAPCPHTRTGPGKPPRMINALRETKRLSFKDKHRLQEVETTMPRLAATIETLELRLSDPTLFSRDRDGFNEASTQLAAARQALEQAETDWLRIEEKKDRLDKSGPPK